MIIAINIWLLNDDTDYTFVENGAVGQKRPLNTFWPVSSRSLPYSGTMTWLAVYVNIRVFNKRPVPQPNKNFRF